MVKSHINGVFQALKPKRAVGKVAHLLRRLRYRTSSPLWGDVKVLTQGLISYARTGTTPQAAYHSLRRLHCRTGGLSNDLLHALVRVRSRPYKLPRSQGVLGPLGQREAAAIAAQIRTHGYYIFPDRLPEALCTRLQEFALTTPAEPYPRRDTNAALTLFARANPAASTYRFPEQVLLENADVQALVADTTILAVAQAYLGSAPILDIITMWWSTTFEKQASSAAAQLYHFDMDRIKFIKFFFYLTDVTTNTGPHCFVAKSHLRGGQPQALLQKYGDGRIPDEDIKHSYPAADLIEMTGLRGTIVAEDTRGFHKGKPLESGDRLLLQLEFCDSLFGESYTKSRLRPTYLPRLLEVATAYKRIYAKFIIEAESG